jgi:hypothetical protein
MASKVKFKTERARKLAALRDKIPKDQKGLTLEQINSSGCSGCEELTARARTQDKEITRLHTALINSGDELRRVQAELSIANTIIGNACGTNYKAEMDRLRKAHDHQREMAWTMLREAERTQRELDDALELSQVHEKAWIKACEDLGRAVSLLEAAYKLGNAMSQALGCDEVTIPWDDDVCGRIEKFIAKLKGA